MHFQDKIINSNLNGARFIELFKQDEEQGLQTVTGKEGVMDLLKFSITAGYLRNFKIKRKEKAVICSMCMKFMFLTVMNMSK